MDLVSNFAGSITPAMFGGNNTLVSTPDKDLGDDTFANLLEKQMNKKLEDINNRNIINDHIVSGINIGDFDKNPIAQNQNINPIPGTENTDIHDFNNRDNYTTSELLTFFNSLFQNKPTITDTSNSGLYNFERKLAAVSYGKYAKNVVTDINEFVTDALKMSH